MSLFKNFKKTESLKKPLDGTQTPPNEKESSLSRSNSMVLNKNKAFKETKKNLTQFEKQTKVNH